MTLGGEDGLERLSRNLRALARRLAHDDASADDLVQEAWLAALETPAGQVRDLNRWLAVVVRNLAARQARRDLVQADLRRDLEDEARADPERGRAAEARVDSVRRLAEAIGGLSEPYRSALELRYFEGCSHAAIAARLERKPEAVKKQIQRGLEQVRARLQREAKGEPIDWGLLLLPLGIEHQSAPISTGSTGSTHSSDGGGATLVRGFSRVHAVVTLVLVTTLALAPVLWLRLREGAPASSTGAATELFSEADAVETRVEGIGAEAPARVAGADREVQEPAVADARAERPYEVRVCVESMDGEPVADALVEALLIDESGALPAVATARTDSEGCTVLAVERAAFGANSTEHRVRLHATANDRATAFDYAVALPRAERLTLPLHGPAARLIGTVLDADGRLLPDADVRVFAVDSKESRTREGVVGDVLVHRARSDANGRFVLDRIPRTIVAVRIALSGHVQGGSIETFDVTPTIERDFVLARAGVVHGTVRDRDGSSLAGAQVTVSTPAEFTAPSVTTDSGGNFRLDGVPAGPRWLSVQHPFEELLGAQRRIQLGPGEDLAWHPILAPLDYLDLRVVDQHGEAVDEATIFVNAENWHAIFNLVGGETARLKLLPPGPNNLVVYTPEHSRANRIAAHVTGLELNREELVIEVASTGQGSVEVELGPAPGERLPAGRLRFLSVEQFARSETSFDPSSAPTRLEIPALPGRLALLSEYGVWDLGPVEVEAGTVLDLGFLAAPPTVRVEPHEVGERPGPWLLLEEFDPRRGPGSYVPLAIYERFPHELRLWPGSYRLATDPEQGVFVAIEAEAD